MKKQQESSANEPAAIPAQCEIRPKLDTLKEYTDKSTAIAREIEQIAQKLRLAFEDQGTVFPTINENFAYLHTALGKDIGLINGKYAIGGGTALAGIASIETISDQQFISRQVIEPLLTGKIDAGTTPADLPLLLQTVLISAAGTQQTKRMKQVAEGLLHGDTVIFLDGTTTALIVATPKLDKRAIEKPQNEATVLASLESFTEDLNTNCSMVIKRLPTSVLRFEAFTVGVLSLTEVRLIWLEGIANATVVEEVRRRLNAVNVDSIIGIGTLAELIEDNPLSIFPKYRQTERPDTTAKALQEGRLAILCNNSPFAIFAPAFFWDNFITMDDYAERSTSASYLRLARYAAFLISILLSPLYLSFVVYNQTIVPQTLALAIAAGRAGVPFPSLVELLIMTFAITIIREAAMRMPGAVGFFIGTLAAVVIGQASVAAGYISASIIIVVAASEISAFAISTTTLVYTSRLINYFFIILSGMFGMFGLINGIAIVFWHLASLESFGAPYLYPFVPFELSAMLDTFIRLDFLRKRFRLLAPSNRARTDK